ncbi:MAG: nuclear transport factor 2 family protein, partial [Acidobacteria bacterium]|nr:nuclear transport factor 2 family protein [Acidobacteriota bacterium]
MKKIIVLVALLVAASACTPVEQGSANNSNLVAANANSATPQASPASVSDADIIAQERQLLDALKAKNWDAFAAKLADDQIYVSGEGVYDKTQSVEGVKKTDFKEFTTSDMKVLKIGQNAAVLTYTNVAKGTYEGKPLPDTPSRDTTIWVNRGGKWLAVFHQETYAQPPATPGASTANSNSAASNSNSTAPGATASPAATAA